MASPPRVSDAATWHGGADTPHPRFSGSVRTSRYVPVADGTRIAIDLFLPKGLDPRERVPTLIMQTPYMRAVEFRHRLFERLASRLVFLGNSAFAQECVRFGYAFVLMDLRGAGASFGTKSGDLRSDAVRDGSDIVDWIVAQPWSNGRVGSTGVSAHGMAAEWLLTAKNDAVNAIVPRFTTFDVFRSTHPGGTIPSRFLGDIGALLRYMDANRLHRMPEKRLARLILWTMVKGIKPVDGPDGHRLLAEAVAEHAANRAFDQDLAATEHRDDSAPGSEGAVIDSQSPFQSASDMEVSGAAIYAYGGWLDASFTRELVSLHNTVRTAGSKLIIGPWAHGGKFNSSPLAGRRQATEFDHTAEIIRFFDRHLRDRSGPDDEPAVRYFTMGEERWKTSQVWPPTAESTSWFLDCGGRMTTDVPASDANDVYRVDFEVGTGVHSRFGKHLTSELFPARYPDRAKQDRRLLIYDSPPLSEDVEVTGHPLAGLHVSSTADDGLFIAYLEDIDPQGAIRVVTDGWLRAKFRAVAAEEPPYWVNEPYRTYLRDTTRPLTPGEVTELRFDLFPTSWLFRRGHRIRLAIAGADKDNLAPVARDQQPVVTVHHGPSHPSRIELPIVR